MEISCGLFDIVFGQDILRIERMPYGVFKRFGLARKGFQIGAWHFAMTGGNIGQRLVR